MASLIPGSLKALTRHATQSWSGAWGSLAMAAGLVGAMALPASANQQETRKALVGLAAYAECKVLHDSYSRARAEAIIQAGIENNGWQREANWLQSPQAARVVKLTSEAMNTSCNDFDQSSPQFIPAMEAIDAL